MSPVGSSILTIEVRGLDKLTFAFGGGIAARVRAELRRTVDKLAVELQTEVKQNWLTGPRPLRLGVDTGTLRRSVNIKRVDTPMEVSSKVGTNVFYGAAWERGNVKDWRGKVQPARPFMEPAYQKLRAHIETTLKASVMAAVKRGGVLGS